MIQEDVDDGKKTGGAEEDECIAPTESSSNGSAEGNSQGCANRWSNVVADHS